MIRISASSPPFIVRYGSEAEPVRFAAEELGRYLGCVLGVELPGEPVPGSPEIRLDLSGSPVLGDEGVEISVRGGVLTIASPSPGSILFGAYEFLRRFCGCRFSGPGPEGEHVPLKGSIDVTNLPLRMVPGIWHRAMQLHWIARIPMVIARIDWMAKNGMNFLSYNVQGDSPQMLREAAFDPETGDVRDTRGRFSESVFNECLLPEIRKRGIKLSTFAHNLLNFLPPETYFSSHPEWYMMKDGKRTASASQLCICTSNREMVETYIRNVLEYLRTHPDVAVLSIGPEDGNGWCECDDCRAMDETPDDVFAPRRHHRSPAGENRSKARRYARFVNEVARAAGEEFPGMKFGYQGYTDLNFPPRGVALNDNIVVKTSNYWRCGAHSIASDACSLNRFFFENIWNWREMHKGEIITGDNFYMGMNAQKSLPYPVDEVICEDWARYRRLGIVGVFPQLNDSSFEVYGLNYTALARAAWQDDVDLQSLLTEYLEGMFGSAGRPLRPIFESFRETIRRIRKSGRDFSVYLHSPVVRATHAGEAPFSGCLRPNSANIACFMDELGEERLCLCLDEAELVAATARERRQVKRFISAVEYWRCAAAFYRLYWPLHVLKGDDFTSGDLPRLRESRSACQRVVDYAEKFPLRGWGWMNPGNPEQWAGLCERIDAHIKRLSSN